MEKNILIADDQNIVRTGIKAIITTNLPGIKVSEATTENEIAHLIKLAFYNMVIFDINMRDTDFIKMMSWVKATSPRTSILIFTMYTEDIYGERCLQLGAKGFLRKTATDAEILEAIQKVLDGKTYINDTLDEILKQQKRRTVTNPFYNLSTRELEIAMLLNKGLSLPEVCTILNIQYSTANTYKRRIFDKLNISNVLALSRLMQSFNIEA